MIASPTKIEPLPGLGEPLSALSHLAAAVVFLGVDFEATSAALGVFQLVPGAIGGHEIFHFAVLLGMAIRWKFISSFADGQIAEAGSRADLTRKAAAPGPAGAG